MGILQLGTALLSVQWGLGALAVPNPGILPRAPSPVVNQTTCNNRTYTYQQLAGYGLVPSNARDKFGDTLGGFGSSIALDRSSWKKGTAAYTGILWVLPDRGWCGFI